MSTPVRQPSSAPDRWRGESVAVRGAAPVTALDAAAYSLPTENPEADGTLSWDRTTIVVARACAGDICGIGYTYTDESAAQLIASRFTPVVVGRDALAPVDSWWAMRRAARNAPARGLVMMAISAVDVALWDLKSRLLDLPMATLLGPARRSAPVYASGGFTSYGMAQLRRQMHGWADEGFGRMKMKVGAEPEEDAARVAAAREAAGDDAELFVDANGAYTVAQAVNFAKQFSHEGVTWFEEPCSSDDRNGLAMVRQRAPEGMEIAAGEYADTEDEFVAFIESASADVLQPDVTRCGGVTGALRAVNVCAAHHVGISTHGAPTLALPVACACPEVRHIEYFLDHARIEHELFEGAPEPESGCLSPDFTRPGHGLELRDEFTGRRQR